MKWKWEKPKASKRGLGWGERKVFLAEHAGTCTNCVEGIKTSERVTWAWGGICHVRCTLNLGSPATRALYATSKPRVERARVRQDWRWAPTSGTCLNCPKPVEPRQPIHETAQGWIHTRCK